MAEPAHRARLRRPFVAIGLAAAVFAFGATVGALYATHWGGTPFFFQEYFMPAVMMACGKGFVDVAESEAPKAAAFLKLKADSCGCSDLPEKPVDADEPYHFRKYWQSHHRNLLIAAAGCFKWLGIRWDSLWPLYGALCGATALFGYLFFRIGMGRGAATLCAIALIAAPMHLEQIPQLRDYSKAAFFMPVWFLMAAMVRYQLKARTLWLLSAAAGLTVGIGLGFREDVLLFAVAFPAAVLLFVPGWSLRRLGVKCAAIAVFASCVCAAGYPNLSAEGKNRWHNVLLGFSQPFDRNLGVDESTVYQWAHLYNDSLQVAITNSYAHRIHGVKHPLLFPSEEYDAMGARRFWATAAAFPADMATRALSSTRRILDFAVFDPDKFPPQGIENPFLVGCYSAGRRLAGLFLGRGRYLAAIAVLLLMARRFRWGAYSLVFILFFCGYACLQFTPRHYFHLVVIPLWCLGFVADRAVRLAGRFILRKTRPEENDGDRAPAFGLKRAVVCVLIVLIAGWLALHALRAYQDTGVRALIEKCAVAPREPVRYVPVPGDRPGEVRLELPDCARADRIAPENQGLGVQTEYLVVELESSRSVTPLAFAFRSSIQAVAFTKQIFIQPRNAAPAQIANEPTQIFFPVYYGFNADVKNVGSSEFAGIILQQDDLPRVRGIYRIKDLTPFALLPELTLTPGWRSSSFYETPQTSQLPASVRARTAGRRNLFPNGGLDAWQPCNVPECLHGELPAGFAAPEANGAIERENALTADGTPSVRQTWRQPDAPNQPDVQFFFRTEIRGLLPKTDYQLFFKAIDESTNPVSVTIARCPKPDENPSRGWQPMMQVVVEPRGGTAFRQFASDSFRVEDTEQPFDILVFTRCTASQAFPVSVVWDDWRLAAIPGP